jgi:hypothetical protein
MGQGDVGGAMQPPSEGVWGLPREMLRTLSGFDPDVAYNRAQARDIMAANEAGCARISLRCASMRRKIALNSRGIWDTSAKIAPSWWSRVSPGRQA